MDTPQESIINPWLKVPLSNGNDIILYIPAIAEAEADGGSVQVRTWSEDEHAHQEVAMDITSFAEALVNPNDPHRLKAQGFDAGPTTRPIELGNFEIKNVETGAVVAHLSVQEGDGDNVGKTLIVDNQGNQWEFDGKTGLFGG